MLDLAMKTKSQLSTISIGLGPERRLKSLECLTVVPGLVVC